MTTTIRPALAGDITSVRALWTAHAADPASCWSATVPPAASYFSGMIGAARQQLCVATDGASAVIAFGYWANLGPSALFQGIVAPDSDTYYRLVAACADWSQAQGCLELRGVIAVRSTTERTWWEQLGAVAFLPFSYLPLPPGGDPATRVVKSLETRADLIVLQAAVALALGES